MKYSDVHEDYKEELHREIAVSICEWCNRCNVDDESMQELLCLYGLSYDDLDDYCA